MQGLSALSELEGLVVRVLEAAAVVAVAMSRFNRRATPSILRPSIARQ
jgi:hypothetical protein